MGRERQKFKNRSSVSKVRQKPKSKKQILQNPIIAANWDQKETLAQNYRRLGLASRLNHAAGGIEKSATTGPQSTESTTTTAHIDPLKIKSKLPTRIELGEARIERDPETGAITQVYTDSTQPPNPLNDPLNEIEDRSGEGWEGFVNEHGLLNGATPAGHSGNEGAETEVVRQLQERAGRPVEKRVRKLSEREQEWVGRLVEKYGDDYVKMSRDIKLNVMQQSPGDIKGRVKRWRAGREEES